MICPECKKAGLKSRVYPDSCSSTLLSSRNYYDETGQYHNHNANDLTYLYYCSNGHSWIERRQTKCWCGWPDTKEKMSGGLKITREITANPKYKKDLDKSIAQLRRGKLFARPKRAEHA